MTGKNFEEPFDDDEAVSPDAGTEAGEPAPESVDDAETGDAEAAEDAGDAEDDLTVDDILGASQNADAAAEDAVLADLESQLLNDLKRLQAEYANYRRRTEDRKSVV